jgi:Protein of unknown function (DUF3224)
MAVNRPTRCALAAGAAATAFLVGAAPSEAGARCFEVRGSYDEHAVSSPCTSVVRLCIAGEYRGSVRGAFSGSATSILANLDTPTTLVSFFTSVSSISATVRGRSGTLNIRNAGAFSAVDGGPIVDLQTIVGGTGGLAGASGALRAQGTFSFVNGGHSSYAGDVCLA